MLKRKTVLVMVMATLTGGLSSCAQHPLYTELGLRDAEAQVSEQTRLQQQLEQALFGSRASLTYRSGQPQLEISDALLYAPGAADVNSDAYFLLNQIAQSLADFQNAYVVLSHSGESQQDQLVNIKLLNLKHYFIARRVSAQRIKISDAIYLVEGAAEPLVIISFKNHGEPSAQSLKGAI